MKNKIKTLRDSTFFKTLISLSVPIIIQNFMAASLNLIDNIMVGQLGNAPVAAVGLANMIYFVFNLFLLGVSGGTSMFIAQFWGTKDIRNIRRILGLSLLLGVSVSLLILLFTTTIPDMIMKIMSDDLKVINLGTKYLKISSISYLFYAISTIYAVSMRSVGHTKPPMAANIIGIFLNSTLNYILIFGKFGFNEMGVTGAAIATTIARFTEMAVILIAVYFHNWPSSARIREMLDLNKSLVRRYFSQSSLLIFKDVIWAIGITIYMIIYSDLGTQIVAAVNILMAVQQVSMVLFVGLAIACQIMLGNLIGAGHNEKAHTYAKRFFLISIISTVITGLILFGIRHIVLIPYKVSLQTTNHAINLIMIFAAYMPISMTNVLFVIGVMRSGGDTFTCIVMDLIAIYIIGLPLALLGAYFWKFDIEIIYALIMTQEIFKSIVLIGRFLTKKWIKNIVHDL